MRSLGLCHQFYLLTLDAIKQPLSPGVPTFGICDLPFPSVLPWDWVVEPAFLDSSSHDQDEKGIPQTSMSRVLQVSEAPKGGGRNIPPQRTLALSASLGWYSWHWVSKDQGGCSTLHTGLPLWQRTSHPKCLQFHDWEIPVFRGDEFQACQRNTCLNKAVASQETGLATQFLLYHAPDYPDTNPLWVLFPLDLRPDVVAGGYRRTERVLEVKTLSKRTSSFLWAPRSMRVWGAWQRCWQPRASLFFSLEW